MSRIPELLAPAGNKENFLAALEAGADAVYAGLPGFNARNLARELRLEELAAMIGCCHKYGKKIYIAANSLILQKELPQVIELLAILESLRPDALIVQDIGLVHLLRSFFPKLKYHASTLMAAHSVMSVRALADLGCERIVLARELSLSEINHICSQVEVETEVFIHGAMCFSYSGLCLFSSYFGGKSGLRGRCVQPCRRSYTVGGQQGKKSGKTKGGYLFSMNDLSGLEAVPALRKAGVASLKIEGRLRSASYVKAVVEAYRKVLDAQDESVDEALAEGQRLLGEAMSRKVSSGYFFSAQPAEAITPFHSGNLGQYLGRIEHRPSPGKKVFVLALRRPVAPGDRLRIHLEPSGERHAFTLKDLKDGQGRPARGEAGTEIALSLPDEAGQHSWKHIDVYKVDAADEQLRPGGGQIPFRFSREEIIKLQKISRKKVEKVRYQTGLLPLGEVGAMDTDEKISKPQPARARHKNSGAAPIMPLEWWLKVSSANSLTERWPIFPDRILLPVTAKNVAQAGSIKRQIGGAVKKIIWTLPAILFDREQQAFLKLLHSLMQNGFRTFQVQHFAHVLLFYGEKVQIAADYTCNISNAMAVRMARELGIFAAQLSIESDRENLAGAIQQYKYPHGLAGRQTNQAAPRLGLTVYGWPALYTSRLATPFFKYDTPIISPKGENFLIEKAAGVTYTVPRQPFSLLPYLLELKLMQLDYVVVDMTHCQNEKKELHTFFDRLSGKGEREEKLATFNYCGKLA